MTRGGQAKTRAGPVRRCIATGESQPMSGLIRFVVGPGAVIVPDILGKLPGRGIWVSSERDAIEQARERNLFSRAAREQVSVPEALLADVEAALVRRVSELLAMARKAGQAVAGFEKAKDWLVRERASVLLQASDGSTRERARLRPPPGKDSHFAVLTASELGLSFGRERVIHAALAAGGLAEKIREDALRLSGVRGEDGGNPAGKAK